jgi:hypothetical protein
LARAVALGTCSGVLTRISGLEVADTDAVNLNESVTRRPRKEGGNGGDQKGRDAGEKAAGEAWEQEADEEMQAEALVKGLDAADWGFVVGRVAWYKWGRLDLR